MDGEARPRAVPAPAPGRGGGAMTAAPEEARLVDLDPAELAGAARRGARPLRRRDGLPGGDGAAAGPDVARALPPRRLARRRRASTSTTSLRGIAYGYPGAPGPVVVRGGPPRAASGGAPVPARRRGLFGAGLGRLLGDAGRRRRPRRPGRRPRVRRPRPLAPRGRARDLPRRLLRAHRAPRPHRRPGPRARAGAAARACSTAPTRGHVLLSTPEAPMPTRAWTLYRRCGFRDVLRHHRFSSDPRPFAVLGPPAARLEPSGHRRTGRGRADRRTVGPAWHRARVHLSHPIDPPVPPARHAPRRVAAVAPWSCSPRCSRSWRCSGTGCVRVRAGLAVSPQDTVSGTIDVGTPDGAPGGNGPPLQVPSDLVRRRHRHALRAGRLHRLAPVPFEDLSFDDVSRLLPQISPTTSSAMRLQLRRAGDRVILSGQVDLTRVSPESADVQLKIAFPGHGPPDRRHRLAGRRRVDASRPARSARSTPSPSTRTRTPRRG